MTICHISPSDSRIVLKMLAQGALQNIQTSKKEHNEIYFNQLINMFSWMKYSKGYPKNEDTIGTDDVNRIVMNAINDTGLNLYYDRIRDLLANINTINSLDENDEQLKAKLEVCLKLIVEGLDKCII